MADANQLPSVLLLALFGMLLGIGFILFGSVLAIQRRQILERKALEPTPHSFPAAYPAQLRPQCWLAVRSVSPEAVRMALGVNRASPCSWAEGLAGEHEFFISPRVNDWVIVTGLGLPHPSDDVDATFLFLTALSRKLGHVQYFYANRLLQHHAWARLDDGCVTRAYAWTGETVWQQGSPTRSEIEIGLHTFAYGESLCTIADAECNLEKIPMLAARWSLDPGEVKLKFARHATGIAGESAMG